MKNNESLKISHQVGKNVVISKDSCIGKGSYIGNNVTIYGQVNIGENVTIFDGSVIGRPPKATNSIIRKPSNTPMFLTIGNGSVIGGNCVIYTGSSIGKNVLIGDLSSIREECVISDNVVVGRNVMIMYNTKIGNNTKIIDGAILTGDMTIEEYVFVGPGVNLINDNSPYLKRYGLKKFSSTGPIIKKYSLIGAGANICGGVVIGKGAIVAPSAMVTKNVKEWTVVMGIPAKYKRAVMKKDKDLIINLYNN